MLERDDREGWCLLSRGLGRRLRRVRVAGRAARAGPTRARPRRLAAATGGRYEGRKARATETGAARNRANGPGTMSETTTDAGGSVLVTGVGGVIGAHAAAEYAQRPGWRVRGVSRRGRGPRTGSTCRSTSAIRTPLAPDWLRWAT